MSGMEICAIAPKQAEPLRKSQNHGNEKKREMDINEIFIKVSKFKISPSKFPRIQLPPPAPAASPPPPKLDARMGLLPVPS